MSAVATTPPLGDEVILGHLHLREATADLIRAGFDYYFPDTGGVMFRARAGLFLVRVRLWPTSANVNLLDLGIAPDRHAEGPVAWRPWSIDHDGSPAAVARHALMFFRVADQTIA